MSFQESSGSAVQIRIGKEDAVLHRDGIDAVDKLATPTNATASDVATGGTLLHNVTYKANVAAHNSIGTTVPATAQSVVVPDDNNDTHSIKLALTQVAAAEGYDLFMSTDANPKWVARITETERAAGGRIHTVGGDVIGDLAAGVAGKIRTALNADTALTALYTVGGTGADITLTRKTKVANDANLNIAIADGTCDGITTAAASANTNAGILAVNQIETATVTATITQSGNATFTITATGMNNSPKALSVAVQAGTAQIETATVVGTITQSGNVRTIVSGDNITGGAVSLDTAVVAGTAQIETAIIAGTVTKAGNATVTVTCTGMGNTPKAISVAVALSDDASAVAVKMATALGLDADVSALFNATSNAENLILTRKTVAANIANLNIAFTNDDCEGLTPDAGSEDTLAGVAADDASAVATKIKTSMNVAAITDKWTVGGAAADITLTRKTKVANDTTLNIAIANGTCLGLTAAPTSTTSAPGVIYDDSNAVAGKARTALGLDADVIALFTVGGTNNTITLTKTVAAADIANLNIAQVDDNCIGVTTAANSTSTLAGVLGSLQVETATVVAEITTSGNATVIVTATGMSGSPKTYSVPVLKTGTAGEIVIDVIGTGLADNAVVFTKNNAFTPADTDIVGIDCTSRANVTLSTKVNVTDLRSTPSATLLPFTKTGDDWFQGSPIEIAPLSDDNTTLSDVTTISVNGAEEVKVLVAAIAGQGTAVDVWAEVN